jgi:hypothetical protein
MALSKNEKEFYLILCGWVYYGSTLLRLVDPQYPHIYRSRPLDIDEAFAWQKKIEKEFR